jgi:hypothetical protein
LALPRRLWHRLAAEQQTDVQNFVVDVVLDENDALSSVINQNHI